MKESSIVVRKVLQGSIAEEAGIEQDDALLSINGQSIADVFDYRFLITNETLVVEVLKPDGDVWEIEIEKDEYEDIGVEFENSMMDEAKSCTNKCIFCFIDQMPRGMRDTLYFKDDDSRLSFMMGNYVTLTNMKDSDIERIIRYRMSPINVSVHTTNPDLRVIMLKNRFAGDILAKIQRLVDAGITVNCQIVLCRGINDGEELDRTVHDLSRLYPGVRSISVVPVGITKYREGLSELMPFDKTTSGDVVQQIEKWQQHLLAEHGSRVVYLADEFYIMAGEDLPDCEDYEDFPQIENGVGLVALLMQEVYESLDTAESSLSCEPRTVSIATGVSAYKYILQLSEDVQKKFGNIKVNVYEIKNDFFGENVTVAGLITGGDLARQLNKKDLGEELLISKSMIKAGEELFLDDMTLDKLESQLNIKIKLVENTGKDFVEKILG